MNKKKYTIFYISIFLVFILVVEIRSLIISKNINDSNQQIIVKFTNKDRKPKTTNFYFTYYFNNKKYVTANSGINYSILNTNQEKELINSLKLNNFYLANFSKEFPNSIKVNPKERVTDTLEILKAGFSRKDLEKNE